MLVYDVVVRVLGRDAFARLLLSIMTNPCRQARARAMFDVRWNKREAKTQSLMRGGRPGMWKEKLMSLWH